MIACAGKSNGVVGVDRQCRGLVFGNNHLALLRRCPLEDGHVEAVLLNAQSDFTDTAAAQRRQPYVTAAEVYTSGKNTTVEGCR